MNDFRANVRKWAVYCFQKHGDDAHLYNGLAELAGMEPWGSVPRCPDCGLVTTASFHLCAGPLKPLAGSVACKYGDPSCPCQDGDPCHYEDTATTKALAPPPPAEVREDVVTRLMAWSHDERLGDGMLLREAADTIAALREERDIAQSNAVAVSNMLIEQGDRLAALVEGHKAGRNDPVERSVGTSEPLTTPRETLQSEHVAAIWQQAKAALIAAVEQMECERGFPRLLDKSVVIAALRATTSPPKA